MTTSLVLQTAYGVLTEVRRSLRLASEPPLCTIHSPKRIGLKKIPAQLLENRCG